MSYSAKEKLDAVHRELKLRKRVYPRLVETGRMSAAMATAQIAIFDAIADDYIQAAKAEALL